MAVAGPSVDPLINRRDFEGRFALGAKFGDAPRLSAFSTASRLKNMSHHIADEIADVDTKISAAEREAR
jgi:hypothetical protein